MSAPEPATALSFTDVSAERGGRIIWSESTFDVEAGRFVAVIGPNGSGKTTLLQVILGLLGPASGSVRVFGRAPGTQNDEIGYVPQNYDANANEAIRARDAVLLGLTGRRWGFGRTSAADRARVEEALGWVDAVGIADRRLSDLSGGQRQRIALAGALVAQPKMLILDEPLASLDVRNQHEIVAVLGRLKRELGVTVLVVAHDLNPLLGVLDSAIYLLDGHAHHAALDKVVDSALLTHMYGTRIQVAHTLQGELYMRSGG
ncbi:MULTISPECIES: metal ABC transporter ATP-binding protein [Mycolicibacterium]|uniref:ATPase component of Mn/Zn ABC-type transporter n=3 Tax=Mycolicibacterium gilvum TaxID=1804 RepID=E6THJ3_MYCSR|nr:MULTISPECIES: ABC transporter ATP-binding protein [Mycolicibacterium]ABP43937.1 ABC transporter related protein [Mycolicibacterium gilvum PYR-GCK]ADU01256.1 ATPase component of Mn/Zn ABC-type transporter [Mycolicibacterium gilvum Spyr1]MBV5243805.1 ABC transporter ATP-binding protein [Mycolicibacterium sp. PAM1]MCV7054425.1 ABC transporter ATP-binding protein [Mycolicibacterium gilvum]STZ45767.1 ABC transporter-like protein [Mycolicibacterium gilvum]